MHEKLAGSIALAMNMGTSKATKDQYRTAIKHAERVEQELQVDMQLPWDVTKTLNYVGFFVGNPKMFCQNSGLLPERY